MEISSKDRMTVMVSNGKATREWKEEIDGIRTGEIGHTGRSWEVEKVVLRAKWRTISKRRAEKRVQGRGAWAWRQVPS